MFKRHLKMLIYLKETQHVRFFVEEGEILIILDFISNVRVVAAGYLLYRLPHQKTTLALHCYSISHNAVPNYHNFVAMAKDDHLIVEERSNFRRRVFEGNLFRSISYQHIDEGRQEGGGRITVGKVERQGLRELVAVLFDELEMLGRLLVGSGFHLQ